MLYYQVNNFIPPQLLSNMALFLNASTRTNVLHFFLYLVPPNATISSLMETSFVADTVSFYCLVEASPPPTIVWLVNGTELDVPAQGSVSLESAGLITLNSSLTLIDIDLDDIGRYSCNATNNLVEVRSDVSEELNLEVLRK